MTSHDLRVDRRSLLGRNCVTVTATLLAFHFATTAFAEGSFFKDRRDVVTQAKPAPAPLPTPTPPNPVPSPPTDEGNGRPGGSGSEEPKQVDVPPPAPIPTPPPQPQPAPGSASISGTVSEVLTTDTLVVDGHRVQLAGVRGNPEMRTALQGWISKNGNALNCRPAGARYRCATPNDKDVGQVVLQNGAGQADTDASPEYRAAEMQARLARRGMWAQR